MQHLCEQQNVLTQLITPTLTFIGLILSIIAGRIAYLSFRSAEKWKKAEFAAAVMKTFTEDKNNKLVFSMIDWGRRHLDLGIPNKKTGATKSILITRTMQSSALRPHTLSKQSDREFTMSAVKTESNSFSFSTEEAKIRDLYDSFLDGLERISNYVETCLIDINSLKPYLEYWIKEIHEPTKSKYDAEYSAHLLTYIEFYNFHGVQRLFKQFGYPIDTQSESYKSFLLHMENQEQANRLKACVQPHTEE